MFEELLARIAGELKEAGLPYMVIGGQAVLLYGAPRLTKDIDITLGVDIGHIEKVLPQIHSHQKSESGRKIYPKVADGIRDVSGKKGLLASLESVLKT